MIQGLGSRITHHTVSRARERTAYRAMQKNRSSKRRVCDPNFKYS